MALLIYKQRHLPANRPVTSSKNQAHVLYIATRPGVVKDTNRPCGLFGSLNGQFQHYISPDSGVAEAQVISDNGITMFRSVISFSEEQAKTLGLKSLDDWQEYVKQQMPIIAKANGIKLEHLNWVAAAHQKAGHPHVHIAFWDTSPNQIQKQFTKVAIIKQLRADLIKNTYPELLDNLYNQKAVALDVLKNSFAELLDDIEPYIDSDNSLLSYEVIDDTIDNINLSVSDVMNDYIVGGFMSIMNRLPDKGSLKYQLLPPELKSELEEYVTTIVRNNEKLNQLFDHYISSQLDISECYTDNEDKLNADKDKYTQQGIKLLCNMILKEMKNVLIQQQDSVDNGRIINDNICLSIIDIFKEVERLTKDNNSTAAAHSRASIGGELSAAAKKELLKKLRDRGIGVEY